VIPILLVFSLASKRGDCAPCCRGRASSFGIKNNRGTNGTPLVGCEGNSAKMLGTVGRVGSLARFLGKFARFSRVPKSAIGTLNAQRSKVSTWFRSRNDESRNGKEMSSENRMGALRKKTEPLGPLANFAGILRVFPEAHGAPLGPLAGNAGVFDGFQRGKAGKGCACGTKIDGRG
jgi:hypothetical protein